MSFTPYPYSSVVGTAIHERAERTAEILKMASETRSKLKAIKEFCGSKNPDNYYYAEGLLVAVNSVESALRDDPLGYPMEDVSTILSSLAALADKLAEDVR
jgi:hypothetical protein